ncbi:MAG: hypothetical protein ABIH39_03810 [Candidatus Margulisiibacteriota bacterium]
MKNLLVVLAVLAIMALAPMAARAESLGFDMGVLTYNPSETTAQSSNGNFFCFTFPVDNTTRIGFYTEGLMIVLKKDLFAAPTPTTVSVDTKITAIQMTRTIAEKANVSAGVNLGMADMNAYILGALAWTQTAPVADLFVKWAFISGTGEKGITTNVSATVGYRSLLIAAQDPDAAAGDFTKAIDNLNGVWVGLSLGVAF